MSWWIQNGSGWVLRGPEWILSDSTIYLYLFCDRSVRKYDNIDNLIEYILNGSRSVLDGSWWVRIGPEWVQMDLYGSWGVRNGSGVISRCCFIYFVIDLYVTVIANIDNLIEYRSWIRQLTCDFISIPISSRFNKNS